MVIEMDYRETICNCTKLPAKMRRALTEQLETVPQERRFELIETLIREKEENRNRPGNLANPHYQPLLDLLRGLRDQCSGTARLADTRCVNAIHADASASDTDSAVTESNGLPPPNTSTNLPSI